jgi:hypothetical protein
MVDSGLIPVFQITGTVQLRFETTIVSNSSDGPKGTRANERESRFAYWDAGVTTSKVPLPRRVEALCFYDKFFGSPGEFG